MDEVADIKHELDDNYIYVPQELIHKLDRIYYKMQEAQQGLQKVREAINTSLEHLEQIFEGD